MNDQLFRGNVHGEIDFFLRPLLVSIVKRVDDPLAHAHPDAIAIVLAKSRGLRHAQTHLLGKVDALHLRLQCDFEMFGAGRHCFAMWLPGRHKVNAFMGNIANETESMDVTTLPWSDAGFYPSAAGNVKQPRGPLSAGHGGRFLLRPDDFVAGNLPPPGWIGHNHTPAFPGSVTR